jgi:hypothetical protein
MNPSAVLSARCRSLGQRSITWNPAKGCRPVKPRPSLNANRNCIRSPVDDSSAVVEPVTKPKCFAYVQCISWKLRVLYDTSIHTNTNTNKQSPANVHVSTPNTPECLEAITIRLYRWAVAGVYQVVVRENSGVGSVSSTAPVSLGLRSSTRVQDCSCVAAFLIGRKIPVSSVRAWTASTEAAEQPTGISALTRFRVRALGHLRRLRT